MQFQPDRMVTNWRKAKNTQNYPRFEGIAKSFSGNLLALSDFSESACGQKIDINQAEVVYVNIIPVDDFSRIGDWLGLWHCDGLDVESFSTSFTEVVLDEAGKPCARLKYDIQSVHTPDGKNKAFKLSLTFRGKPVDNDIESAMSFIGTGREHIVSRFDKITTKHAHQLWGKQ